MQVYIKFGNIHNYKSVEYDERFTIHTAKAY